MSILQNKVLISVKSASGELRFFNRITQGFTARFRTCEDGGYFYDTTGRSVRPYFNSFKQHNQSESIWQALCDNDDALVYRKFTFGHLVRGNVSD